MRTQQVAAESVDRPDSRGLELRQRSTDSARLDTALPYTNKCAVELRTNTQLHLAGSLLREGDGDDRGQLPAATRDHCHDALHELGRFTCTGGSLHDERLVERVPNRMARAPID